MKCRRCAASLTRPGDFCLVCRSANADAVVLDIDRDRCVLTMLHEGTIVGESTVTTIPESDPDAAVVERRNFAGQIVDEIHRKRPKTVYAAGNHEIIAEIRAQSHHDFRRVEDGDPVAAALAARTSTPLRSVDIDPADKLGGRHSTIIGGRRGMQVIGVVAAHPNVKKIVPGPIDAGGTGSQSGLRAKATRADRNGNIRLLLRTGSSVQENRIVTTAADRDGGERIRSSLNEELDAAGW